MIVWNESSNVNVRLLKVCKNFTLIVILLCADACTGQLHIVLDRCAVYPIPANVTDFSVPYCTNSSQLIAMLACWCCTWKRKHLNQSNRLSRAESGQWLVTSCPTGKTPAGCCKSGGNQTLLGDVMWSYTASCCCPAVMGSITYRCVATDNAELAAADVQLMSSVVISERGACSITRLIKPTFDLTMIGLISKRHVISLSLIINIKLKYLILFSVAISFCIYFRVFVSVLSTNRLFVPQ